MSKLNHKTKNFVIGCSVIVIVCVVIGITSWASNIYLNQQYVKDHDGCSANQINHKVIIQNDKVTPSHTIALRCETLTITNQDDVTREVAFGPHEDHVAYDGVKEKLLAKNQSLTVTLIQVGSFRFHDHVHDEVQGTFTVK